MLLDKHEYKNNDGNVVSIMGPTKHYPEFVYSIQGNWYERETGKFVSYKPRKYEENIEEKDRFVLLPEFSRHSISKHEGIEFEL